MRAGGRTPTAGAIIFAALVAPLAVSASRAVEPPASAETAASLPAILEGYRAIAPRADGSAVQDRVGRIGHLELRLAEGAVFPLEAPGGKALGFYFEGAGHYSYRPDDADDRRVLETNVRRYAHALRSDEHEVADRIQRLLVFFAAPALSELWEPRSDATRPLEPRSRAALEKMWKRLVEGDYLNYDHLSAEARMNGGRLQFVYAEIEGERATVGYTFDRARGFEEILSTFVKVQGVDVRIPQILSRNRVPAEDDGPVAWNLEDVRLNVATEDNRRGTIESDLTLEAARGGLRVAPLSLVNSSDPDSFNWASEKNRLRVLGVKDASGTEIPFSHRYNELLVQLPRALEKGERITLRVAAEGDIFTNRSGENVDNYFELFDYPWYPRPFGWAATPYTFSLKIRTRKPYYPVASGDTTAFREDENHFELEASSTVPVSDVAVFAGKYKTHEETADGVAIRVHSYAMANKFVVEVLPRLARELIRYYRDHLGPYPFDKLEIVEVPSYGVGVAPPGMILLPTEAYKPRRDWLARYLSREVPSLIAHGIAHQWFGHKARPAAPEENWLAESFAEYLAGLAMGAFGTDERRVAGFKRMHSEWKMYAERECPDLPLAAANDIGGAEGLRDRFCVLYDRGPMVLHMLRTMVGDEKFFAILKRFLDDAAPGSATTEVLKKAAAKTLDFNLDWFFDEWFREGGIPSLRVEQKVTPGGSGKYVLSGMVEQAEGPSFKKMLVPLVVDYRNGTRGVKLVFAEKPVQEFRFELRDEPRKVEVDPSNNNLAVYR